MIVSIEQLLFCSNENARFEDENKTMGCFRIDMEERFTG